MGILLDTAWIISEVERFWFGAEKIREYAQWLSDKTAKTGFVGFGSTHLGVYQSFWGRNGYAECQLRPTKSTNPTTAVCLKAL